MSLRIVLTVFVVMMAMGAPSVAGAQTGCGECEPLATRLRDAQQELRAAEARFRELQNRLVELEASQTQAAVAAIPALTAQVEVARVQVIKLTGDVNRAAVDVNECRRNCQKKPQPPKKPLPPPGQEVDETIPRAACQKCQPIVDRIKDLQRQRREVIDGLRDIDKGLADHAARMDAEMDRIRTAPGGAAGVGDFNGLDWLGEGFARISHQAAERRRRDDLTAQIAQALVELTACNWRCTGQEPPDAPANAGPAAEPPAPPPPPVCQPCADAAAALASAEARKKFIQDELQAMAESEGLEKARHEMSQAELKELRASGQGGSERAKALEGEIEAHDFIEEIGDFFGTDPMPDILKKELSTLETQIPELKQKLEACEEERCRPQKTSGVWRSPWPYVGAGALAVAGVVGGGSDGPASVSAPLPPVAAPVQPPVTTTNPAPPVPTAPTGRTPLGTQTVLGCVCAVDTAVRDAVLRFCQQVQVLNVTVTSPGIMRVVFPAPYPSVNVPFNATTGEFLATVPGPNGESMTFGGAIDQAGNFANAFTHFDLTTMRRTGYTFTTVGR